MFSISKLYIYIKNIYFCEKINGREILIFFLRNLPLAFQSGSGEGASEAALMKVNLGTVTWRAPDCVLRIPALRGRTQLEPQHISPTRAHFGFLVLGGYEAAGAFSVRSWMALRACRRGFSPGARAPWASSRIGITQRS